MAGPVYVVVGLALALTRPDFDPRRHPLSLLMLGDWGWAQTINLIVTGLMVVAAAIGLRRALHGSARASRVGLLLGLFGIGSRRWSLPAGSPPRRSSGSWPSGAPS